MTLLYKPRRHTTPCLQARRWPSTTGPKAQHNWPTKENNDLATGRGVPSLRAHQHGEGPTLLAAAFQHNMLQIQLWPSTADPETSGPGTQLADDDEDDDDEDDDDDDDEAPAQLAAASTPNMQHAQKQDDGPAQLPRRPSKTVIKALRIWPRRAFTTCLQLRLWTSTTDPSAQHNWPA